MRCIRLERLVLSFKDRDDFAASWSDFEPLPARLASLRQVMVLTDNQPCGTVGVSPVPLAAVCDAVEAHDAPIFVVVDGLAFTLPENVPNCSPRALDSSIRRDPYDFRLLVRRRPASTFRLQTQRVSASAGRATVFWAYTRCTRRYETARFDCSP